MGDSLLRGKKKLACLVQQIRAHKNKQKIILTLAAVLVAGYFFYTASEPVFYDSADGEILTGGIKIDLQKNLQGETFFAVANETAQQGEGVLASKSARKGEVKEIEKRIYDMVGEAPIKEMVPFIAKQDKTVAALVVGIAKKESSWGERAPSLKGQDCFNYWGYKGAGSRGTAMGYGCFATPEEGAQVISARIKQLVEKDLTTPSKMVVWKCGSSCAGHDPVAVQKWISDVNLYFGKIIAFAG